MLESAKDHRTKLSQAQWTGLVTEVPERDEQDDPPVMQNADSNTRRKTDDEILMKCKAEGITYKEIKKRLRTKVAESTLRGRYRALTKPRKDRVRKPVWTENDVSFH
jgi:tryptophanyl-tRNA synthetase